MSTSSINRNHAWRLGICVSEPEQEPNRYRTGHSNCPRVLRVGNALHQTRIWNTSKT